MMLVRTVPVEAVEERKRLEADARDTVIVAELEGRRVGSMKVTLTPLVHDMRVETGMTAVKVAEAMMLYACGFVKASGFQEALVLVAESNEAMHRFVEGRSVEEPKSRAYMMAVL